MGKYIFVENNLINGAGEVEQLTEGVLNIEVSDTVYEEFLEDALKYKYEDGEIILNPEYETLKQQEVASRRIEEITAQLAELDAKRIRAVCEDEVKDEKTGETWLDYYNAQIYELRVELNSLQAGL